MPFTDSTSVQANLAGTGTSPDAALSMSSLDFGGVPVGSTSSAKTVLLTNTGNSALTISSISASGDFASSTNCGSSLGGGASCKIFVNFSPLAVGTRKGTLTVKDDASSGGTQSASLIGSGLVPSVKLSPTTLAFDKQRKGTTSGALAITLKNVGKATLHIASVSASGDFSETNSCRASVAIGASCTISVTFHPTAEGVRSGTLTVKDDAGSQHASLSGLGVFPAFSISGTKLAFPRTAIGQPGKPKTISITNAGTDRLYIQSLTITGDFTQTNTCEPYVNPTITCTITVTFDPKQLRRRDGVLAITHDLGTATVSLTGVGLKPLAPEPTISVSLSPVPRTIVVPGSPLAGARGHNHILRFILAGGIAVLLIGGVLLFFARDRNEPDPMNQLPGAVALEPPTEGEPSVEGEPPVGANGHDATSPGAVPKPSAPLDAASLDEFLFGTHGPAEREPLERTADSESQATSVAVADRPDGDAQPDDGETDEVPLLRSVEAAMAELVQPPDAIAPEAENSARITSGGETGPNVPEGEPDPAQ